MPVYEYYCPCCKSHFELLQSMNQMTASARCPECDTESAKVLSVFAAVSRSAEGFSTTIAGGGGCACGNGTCGCCA